jgi:hypothetical protein
MVAVAEVKSSFEQALVVAYQQKIIVINSSVPGPEAIDFWSHSHYF